MQEFKILIADDVPFMRQFLKNCLITEKVRLVTDEAGNGEAVIEKLKYERFDIILCDWEMPGVKGDDILKWLRTESDCRDMPFIMVTGNGEKEYIMKALELGVTDYIVKPVNCDTLVKKLIKALKSSEM